MVFLTPESYSEDSCGVLLLTIFLKRWQDRQNNQSDNQRIIDLKLKKSLEYTWDFFSVSRYKQSIVTCFSLGIKTAIVSNNFCTERSSKQIEYNNYNAYGRI